MFVKYFALTDFSFLETYLVYDLKIIVYISYEYYNNEIISCQCDIYYARVAIRYYKSGWFLISSS